jgi:hypothetical protein
MQVLDHDEVRARVCRCRGHRRAGQRHRGGRIGRTPPRQHLHDGEQELLLMPSFLDGGAR